MVYSIRVSDPRCKFSASHFLYQHDKCSRLHGHNYTLVVEISGDLDEHFYVIDFYELKTKMIEITNTLDHAVLLPEKSEKIKIEKFEIDGYVSVKVDFNGKHYEFPGVDVRLLPI